MTRQQTTGEKRVRLDFNPSALPRVTKVKKAIAGVIDLLENAKSQIASNAKLDKAEVGDFMREAATAQTQLQIASMVSVGAMTHEAAFKSYDDKKELSHLERLKEEEANLKEKLHNLGAFIEGSLIFGTLSTEAQTLLKEQFTAMTSYHSILVKRIELENE